MDKLTCTKCGVTGGVEYFRPSSFKYYKERTTCRKCIAKRMKIYIKRESVKISKQRAQFRDENRKRLNEDSKNYYHRNKEKIIKKTKKYSEKNHKKVLAQARLRHEVKVGRVIRPKSCEMCGSGKRIDGHHKDYDKPLDVVWLCHGCHSIIHKRKKVA